MPSAVPTIWDVLLFPKEAALLTITVLQEQVVQRGLWGYSSQRDSMYFIHDAYDMGSGRGTWANTVMKKLRSCKRCFQKYQ
jgi:hypothetical protein